MSFADQRSFDVRCEWGAGGAAALAGCRTLVVVDVLSFSTCVAVAAERGVTVLPYRARDADAAGFAAGRGAVLAGPRGSGFSLSPASLMSARPGTRVVLPSPNGAAVCLEAARHGRVLAGCLRNRSAVGARAAALGGPFGIIPAGERWDDGTLRFALEDLLGAGAIAARLPGWRSPEADAAVVAFEARAGQLAETLAACASGRELVERGYPQDVDLAARLDVDTVAPELVDGEFVAVAAG